MHGWHTSYVLVGLWSHLRTALPIGGSWLHQHNPTTTGRIGTNEKQCGGCCSSGGPAHARTHAHVYVYVVHAHVGISQLMSGCYCYHPYYTHTYTRQSNYTHFYLHLSIHSTCQYTHRESERTSQQHAKAHARAVNVSVATYNVSNLRCSQRVAAPPVHPEHPTASSGGRSCRSDCAPKERRL